MSDSPPKWSDEWLEELRTRHEEHRPQSVQECIEFIAAYDAGRRWRSP